MKVILVMGLLLVSSTVFSASVSITSFNLVRIAESIDHPVAELCGKVTNSLKTVEYIKVLVDKGSRRPGFYNTISDDKGNFCLTIVTYRGSAEVSIIGEKSAASAKLK